MQLQRSQSVALLLIVGLAMGMGMEAKREHPRHRIHRYVEECKQEMNVQQVNFSQVSMPREGRCFIACYMKKTGVMSKDGLIVPSAIPEFYGSFATLNDVKLLMKNCSRLKNADECDLAMEFYKCNHWAATLGHTHSKQ